MNEPASDSMQLDSFKLELVDVADVGLDKLHALSMSVGWPHRAEDWLFLRDNGKGVAALDEIGRVVGSAMWFPYGLDFATVGMVITSPRLQANGAGQWLMQHVFSQVHGRDLRLSATHAARRLYLSLNFKPEAIVYQCQGEALEPPDGLPEPDAVLRRIEPSDLDAIAELDEAAFGANRKALLARLLVHSKGIALTRSGKIAALSLCRPFGRGHVVGPVVAATDADAISVVRPHVAEHAGGFLRLDTRERVGEFSDFLTRCGLTIFDTVTTMSLGRRRLALSRIRAGHRPKTYGLASQALG